MPRKQRFKPSRKPKPNPQTEEAMIGHPVNHASAGNDNVEGRPAPQDRDDRDEPAPTASEDDRRAR